MVGEAVEAPLGEDTDHRHRTAEGVERQADGCALEVGAGQHHSVVREEDRVVADAVGLDLELFAGPAQLVTGGADDLGRRAHAVGVLDLDLLLSREEVGAVDHRSDVGRRNHRAAETAQLVQPPIVGFHVGAQGLEAHRASDLRLLEEPLRVPHREAADGVGEIRAVDDREAVARFEPGYRDTSRLEGLVSGHPGALIEGLAFAHHQECDLAHRREVAAGPNRALLAHHRCDTGVQHGDQGVGDLGPAAGVAVSVDIGPEHHRRADVIDGTGLADARGVVVNQVALEIADLLVREDNLRKLADAGVDPIHDLASLDSTVEKGTTTRYSVARVGMQIDVFAVPGDRNDIFNCEVGA
jgi:hypothetical protein